MRSTLPIFRHSRMLLAGIQANFRLDPPIGTFGGDNPGEIDMTGRFSILSGIEDLLRINQSSLIGAGVPLRL